jgi:hypothetical protein
LVVGRHALDHTYGTGKEVGLGFFQACSSDARSLGRLRFLMRIGQFFF